MFYSMEKRPIAWGGSPLATGSVAYRMTKKPILAGAALWLGIVGRRCGEQRPVVDSNSFDFIGRPDEQNKGNRFFTRS